MQGHIIAILRTDLTPEQRVERLGRILGITPFEARQHSSHAPRAVTSRPSADEANTVVARLANEGMTAAVFHQDTVLQDNRRFVCRTLAVADGGVRGLRKDGSTRDLAWADISAIFVGVRKGVAFTDLLDTAGGAFTARERDTLFDANSGLPTTGGRAGVVALGQAARDRSNGRFDDRLLKPATLAQVCGGFASSPLADDLAESILLRSLQA